MVYSVPNCFIASFGACQPVSIEKLLLCVNMLLIVVLKELQLIFILQKYIQNCHF